MSKRIETIIPPVLMESPSKKKLSRQGLPELFVTSLLWQVMEFNRAIIARLNEGSGFHRTQCGTRRLCTSDKIHYLEKEWRSTPLCSSDLISSKETKTQHEILTRELFIEMLIRESKFNNSNSFKPFDIPSDFITLVTTDFINNVDESNEETELGISNSSSITNKNKLIWISFGKWLGMKEPIKRRDIRRHLK
ncbi:hypothetical protein RhiirC2_792795 [Rhizophagus irregularis]|uniref:Uncharacterized protein n=1 Tax=Rhizophagus irregularis TaxID=588596 RepID=A0A2N1MGP1_9GLOM|nr:hypothetical protein RhiirC2_792795 [Rhizophagus irregularis]